jgi:hypothetical protein
MHTDTNIHATQKTEQVCLLWLCDLMDVIICEKSSSSIYLVSWQYLPSACMLSPRGWEGDCTCLTYACKIDFYYCLSWFVFTCVDQCTVFCGVSVSTAWIVIATCF